jgi:hypothetical protein
MKYIKIMSLLLPAVLLAPMITADQPILGTGTFTPTSAPSILDTRVADGNTIITAMQPFTVLGTLMGTEVLTFHEVIHPNGTVDIQSFGVFTDGNGHRHGRIRGPQSAAEAERPQSEEKGCRSPPFARTCRRYSLRILRIDFAKRL